MKFEAPKNFRFPALNEDDPVEIRKAPDAPELVVPVLNLSDPLVPADPAFDVEITMLPDDVSLPEPVERETAPPVRGKLVADVKYAFPPSSVTELPSDT